MANTTHAIGATSKIVTVDAIVISTGLPYTAGAFNTATISATYTRDGATAPVAITLVSTTVGVYNSTAGHGFVHRGKGTYELSAPNAAFVTGADGVEFAVDGIADVLFRGCRVELVAGNPRSAPLTEPVEANVVQMNSAAVTGTGLTGDLWRGVAV